MMLGFFITLAATSLAAYLIGLKHGRDELADDCEPIIDEIARLLEQPSGCTKCAFTREAAVLECTCADDADLECARSAQKKGK